MESSNVSQILESLRYFLIVLFDLSLMGVIIFFLLEENMMKRMKGERHRMEKNG